MATPYLGNLQALLHQAPLFFYFAFKDFSFFASTLLFLPGFSTGLIDTKASVTFNTHKITNVYGCVHHNDMFMVFSSIYGTFNNRMQISYENQYHMLIYS